jgi:hypothetical protein
VTANIEELGDQLAELLADQTPPPTLDKDPGRGLVISIGRWGGFSYHHNSIFTRIGLGFISIIYTRHDPDGCMVDWYDLHARQELAAMVARFTEGSPYDDRQARNN